MRYNTWHSAVHGPVAGPCSALGELQHSGNLLVWVRAAQNDAARDGAVLLQAQVRAAQEGPDRLPVDALLARAQQPRLAKRYIGTTAGC